MKSLTAIPEVKAKSVCEKHGEYEHRYMPMFNNKFMESSACVKCIKEEEEAKRKADDERLKGQKAHAIADSKSWSGVSKRQSRFKFSDLDSSTEKQEKITSRVKRWCEEFQDDKNKVPSMIMTGKVGTGKTLLASCAINHLIESNITRGESMYYAPLNRYKIIKLVDMVRMLKDTWRRDSDKSEIDLLRHLSKLDILVIDEVGMGFESDTEKMFVFDVIDGRYQNELPTILISNLNMEGIKNSIGDRAVDRLRDGGGILLGLDWESYRK
ncbi:P-loop containing nucleoside triphosphate hydrolase [Vibrio phage LP.2]|nr:P-loop containing nucleoside triphosphate hydrolase [Vibrio phage LP.2]